MTANSVTNELIKTTYDNQLSLHKTQYHVMCLTSLCPTTIHNAEYQNANVNSWNKLGLKCFSLNCEQEQPKISYPQNITVITEHNVNQEAINRFNKYFVSIDTIFDIFRKNKDKYDVFMLINSDIYLNYDPVYFESLLSLVHGGNVVFIRRYDYKIVDNTKEILGVSGGADIFLFHKSHLDFFGTNVGYLLGCPLFDGWILDTCINKHSEIKTYYASSMFAMHQVHRINWNREIFMFIRKITSQHASAKFELYYKKAINYDVPSGKFVIPITNEIWQYPCITEKQAFDSLVKLQHKLPSNVRYYAINWATLIDKHNIQTVITNEFVTNNKCPPDMIGITVCQSIYFRKILQYLKLLNISVLFTPHKIIGQNQIDGILIKPFPLYAVNVEDSVQNKTINYMLPKDIYFSFVGACSHKGHLSDIRTKIFELTKLNLPNVVIKDTNNQWHFNTLVYDHQCKSSNMNDNQLKTYANNTAAYNNILCRSRYSLCPSGTGPNSLRFWESLAVGAIPVLLADTLDLPTIAEVNWTNTIVSVKESKCNNIDNILKQISKEQEETLQNNCKKAYTFFSKDYFSEYIVREIAQNLPKFITVTNANLQKNTTNNLSANVPTQLIINKMSPVNSSVGNTIYKSLKFNQINIVPTTNGVPNIDQNKKQKKIVDMIRPASFIKSGNLHSINAQQNAVVLPQKIRKYNVRNASA